MKTQVNVKVRSILLSVLMVSFLLSCTRDDDPSNDMDFQFPLKVGNSWKYDYTVVFDYDSIAESNGYPDRTYYNTETLDIISYEKIFQDSIPVYNFYSTWEGEDVQQGSSNNYYNVSGDSLICFGYHSPGEVVSPKLSKYNYIFAGKVFQNPLDIVRWINQGFSNHYQTKEDSITYDPVTVYKYPFNLGNEWVYRQSQPWRMTKKVSDSEKMVTQAGEFNCWKVETFYPDFQTDDFRYFDHISEIGLVKRTWEDAPGTVVDENGITMGTFTFTTEQTLIEYDLEN